MIFTYRINPPEITKGLGNMDVYPYPKLNILIKSDYTKIDMQIHRSQLHGMIRLLQDAAKELDKVYHYEPRKGNPTPKITPPEGSE